ncbi:DUF2934 domain-containing protein [Fibrobacter sp. UWB11]|uniref:DUF2934 domain-containing protein n=1 Tax=Fibrobacter sp. UWB11 TaxID=1896202 RepID=UPI00092A629F|nr:DUF2934 domain-containing protein [Fibrobacter sp. UWB11]SIN96377.1 Protein of unknown function [Fibrobacter sp. UWB11]
MRRYENIGFCPKNVSNDFSNGIRGICHDENYWYIAQGPSIKAVPVNSLDKNLNYVEKFDKFVVCPIFRDNNQKLISFYKYGRANSSTPLGIKVEGVCFGDIDCYKGYIFAPITSVNNYNTQILIISTKTFDCVSCEILYKKDSTPFQKLNWCAVNPLDECLYVSDAYVSTSFDGPSSPVLAFKINFNNIERRSGTVFSCVNRNGIKLERKVKLNSEERVPYILDAEVRGGCFDPFDTLYLSTNSNQDDYIRNKAYYLWLEKGRPIQSIAASKKDWLDANSQIEDATEAGRPEREGITAFELDRVDISTNEQHIRETAYYIWVAKGRPYQSEEERKKDWTKAIRQVKDTVRSGISKSDGAAFSAVAFVKAGMTKYTDDSIIDFSFDDSNLEEPAGITYWDLRRYSKENEFGNTWNDGCLHALKLKNKNTTSTSFSLQNYVLRNLETTSVVLNYKPNLLTIERNIASNRYFIMCQSEPIKEFATYDEASTALQILKKYKSIILMGRCASNEEEYDLCYDVLYERVAGQSEIKNVKFESVHFDSFHVDNLHNVVENKWKSDYEVVLELNDYAKFKESYQRIALPVHNTSVGSLIEDIIANHSNYTIENGGRLNYIKSSSKRQRDTLYWFD